MRRIWLFSAIFLLDKYPGKYKRISNDCSATITSQKQYDERFVHNQPNGGISGQIVQEIYGRATQESSNSGLTNHLRLFLDIPGQYKSTYEERDVAIDTATITTHHTHQSLSRSKPWPPFPTVDADSYYLRPHKPYSPTDFLDARWNNMLLGNVTITTHSMIFAQLWTSEIQGRTHHIIAS